MNPKRVSERKLPVLGRPRPGRLCHYVLKFNKVSRLRIGSASANIVQTHGGWVDGVLYALKDSHSIAVMDKFENSPTDYAREVVTVHVRDAGANGVFSGEVKAWTYIGKPEVLDDQLKPTREYLNHVLSSPFMDASTRHRLNAIDCFDD